jgi:16S rRNA G1207 methylase RsmC
MEHDMKRMLEPELMEDVAQAPCLRSGGFCRGESGGSSIVFCDYFPDWHSGHVVDLGCGPGDIPIRFLRAYPEARVTAVDAQSSHA